MEKYLSCEFFIMKQTMWLYNWDEKLLVGVRSLCWPETMYPSTTWTSEIPVSTSSAMIKDTCHNIWYYIVLGTEPISLCMLMQGLYQLNNFHSPKTDKSIS